MSENFEDFIKELFEAIRSEDKAFIRKVYGGWLEHSGVVPKGQEGMFYDAAFGDLKSLLEGKLERVEGMDDFRIAHFKSPSGDFSLTFRQEGEGFIFFNERTNLDLFQKVYALQYDVRGTGRLRLLFNGKRSPVVADIEGGRSGFNSMINAALEVGGNGLTLQPLDGSELEASIRISSAKQGEIMHTGQGDVLNWSGKVKDDVRLEFKTE